MKRRLFLSEFLGALGAVKIEWHQENEAHISGTVIYEKNDPEEVQDFIWYKQESEVPDLETFNLTKLIRSKKLLHIDQLTVTRNELHDIYNKHYNINTSFQQFINILGNLERVEVPMVDDGKEGDYYFIHE